MGGTKNSATKSNGGVKIVELGNELRVDPRQIVAVAQEMAMENAKVPASWVTAGQADRLRAKFGGHKELKARIDRKLKHFESALETPAAEKVETAVKAHTPKMGKKTFESDRRAIFGVVGEAGQARAEKTSAPSPSENSSAPVEPAAAQPPKKFIGIKVAPPIRRESGAADPRFGVSVPVPETEKKPASTAIWGNLNDGHAPVDFSEPSKFRKNHAADDASAADKELVAEAAEVPGAETKTEAASEKPGDMREEVPREEPPSSRSASARSPASETSHRNHELEVPVKRQPRHKAYGAKAKLKSKAHKQIQDMGAVGKSEKKRSEKRVSNEPSKLDAPYGPKPVPDSPGKPESKRKSAKAAPQSESIFTRLIRKIFKK